MPEAALKDGTNVGLRQAPSGRESSRAWVMSCWLWTLSLLCLFANDGQCESLRITTWNLGLNSSNSTYSRSLDEAAAALRELDPDVILLQQVPDWHACSRLAQALEPLEYNILVCSSFPAAGPRPAAQVAILSKYKGYFAWSDASNDAKGASAESGLVFAAIQAGTQRLGFFSAYFQTSSQEPVRKLLGDIKNFQNWETNQVQTFVIAAAPGTFVQNPSRTARHWASAFEEAGLIDATEDIAQPKQNETAFLDAAAEQCFFAGPMGFPFQTRMFSVPGFATVPVTCELELDPDRVTAAVQMRAARLHERPTRLGVDQGILWWGAAGVIGLALLIARFARSRARRKSLASAGTRLPVRGTSPVAALQARPVIVVNKLPTVGNPETPAPPPGLRLKHSPRLALRAAPEGSSIDPPTPPPELAPPELVRQSGAAAQPVACEPQETLPAKPPGVVDPAVREGVVRELATWLKHKFVRKLVQDRGELIEAQQLATRMAATLDTRLARIEAQIQVQNQAYLARIEELNRELAAAREENRELIRERIAQVKAEMEAARARVLAEAHLDNSSLRL